VTTPGDGAVPVKDASTIMVLRDVETGPGIEVLMLRRNSRSDWVGGAHLFPGGAVDEEDHSDEVAAVCSGRSDEEASAALGVDKGGRGFFVAAIRECYEEAGILLARRDDGKALSFEDAATAARFEEWRRRLNADETRLATICHHESLTLALDTLGYFSHWITPEGSPRRYDTRFFVAVLPPGQTALHDDREVVDSTWIRPGEALARHRDGTIDMMFPTMKNLQAVDRFERAEDVLAAAAAAEVPTVLPRVTVEDDGGVRILLPGDEGYDDATGLVGGAQFPDLPRRMRPTIGGGSE
jgi:8-oxo-dGTP pyrophosphatase MutT (NUDIX family)